MCVYVGLCLMCFVCGFDWFGLGLVGFFGFEFFRV